jgi:hypothetical protein
MTAVFSGKPNWHIHELSPSSPTLILKTLLNDKGGQMLNGWKGRDQTEASQPLYFLLYAQCILTLSKKDKIVNMMTGGARVYCKLQMENNRVSQA